MSMQDKLFSNKAMISIIPDPSKISVFNEPMLTVFIDGENVGEFPTYTQCCNHIIMILES